MITKRIYRCVTNLLSKFVTHPVLGLPVLTKLCIFSFMLIYSSVQANSLKVNKIELDVFDISAKNVPVVDSKGKICALFKIYFPYGGFTFSADGEVAASSYDKGQYNVYLSENTSKISLIKDEKIVYTVDLTQYDVLPLYSSQVYHVFLEEDKPNNIPTVEVRLLNYKRPQISNAELTSIETEASKKYEEVIRKVAKGSKSDIEDDLQKLQDIADKGSMGAAFLLGKFIVEHKEIFNARLTDAEFYLAIALEYGKIPRSGYYLGNHYIDKQDYEKAVECYFVGENLGDDYCTNALALMYAQGIGVEKDIDLAIEMWRELYWNSTTRFPEKNKPIDYLTFYGGSLHLVDDFTNPDIIAQADSIFENPTLSTLDTRARYYFPIKFNVGKRELLQNHNLEYGIFFIDLLTKTTTKDRGLNYPLNLPNEEMLLEESVKLIESEAEKMNPRAMNQLALMYKNGIYYAPNRKKALEIYTNGARTGDRIMAENGAKLADLLQEFDLAYNFSIQAYEKGSRNKTILIILARNYANQSRVKKDPLLAIKYIEEAIEAENNPIEKRKLRTWIETIKRENKL